MDRIQNDVNPIIFWVVVGVLVVGVAGFFVLRARGPAWQKQTGGREGAAQKVQPTGTFYTPPAGAPVPGAGGMRPMTPPGGGGGSSFQPPMGVPGGGR